MSEIIDINVTKEVEQIDINVTENVIEVNINSVSGGGASWGEIDGTLSNQTDLQNALNLKANESDLDDLVPYIGATQNVDLGAHSLRADEGFISQWDNDGVLRLATPFDSLTKEFVFNGGKADYTLEDQFCGIYATSEEGVYLDMFGISDGDSVSNGLQINTNGVNLKAQTGSISNNLVITKDETYGTKKIITDEGFEGNSLQLNTAAVETSEVGKLKWNDTDGTLDLGLKGGNVTLQIGQESVIRVVNKTGSNLLESNYQAVRVTGAQGQRLKVDLAQATTDMLSAETIGLVTETISNNQEGFVTTSGLIRSINTTGSLQSETWSDGDILYLSPSVAGRITNVKPTAPNHLVIIGYVVHSHANNGSIFVKVDNGYELDELHNVKITDVQNNDLLSYNSSLQIWENKALIQQSNKGVFTGGITWTGTTAPSGTTSHSYNWIKIGNLVTLNVTLAYGTAGTALTSVVIGFMNNFPTPIKPDGLTSALNILYPAFGKITISETAGTTGGFDSFMRSNSANNGFEFVINQASLNAKVVRLTISYFTS